MCRALIVVDVQKDFREGGSVPVKGGCGQGGCHRRARPPLRRQHLPVHRRDPRPPLRPKKPLLRQPGLRKLLPRTLRSRQRGQSLPSRLRARHRLGTRRGGLPQGRVLRLQERPRGLHQRRHIIRGLAERAAGHRRRYRRNRHRSLREGDRPGRREIRLRRPSPARLHRRCCRRQHAPRPRRTTPGRCPADRKPRRPWLNQHSSGAAPR